MNEEPLKNNRLRTSAEHMLEQKEYKQIKNIQRVLKKLKRSNRSKCNRILSFMSTNSLLLFLKTHHQLSHFILLTNNSKRFILI
jgi:hypothetical protein